MKPTCLALDFDGTLAYFDGGKEDLYTIFTDQGISMSLAREAYEQIRDGGFSIGKMIDYILDKTDVVVDADLLFRKNMQRVQDQLHLYPDAEIFRESFSLPVAIVTFGDEANQRFNIEKVGLAFDDLKTTQSPNSKHQALSELVTQYGGPVAFVDDKATELDAIRNGGLDESQVLTFRMVRDQGEHNFQQASHEHQVVSSITELLEKLNT